MLYNNCERCLEAFSDEGDASYTLQINGQEVSTISYQGQAGGASVTTDEMYSDSQDTLQLVTLQNYALDGNVSPGTMMVDCSYSGQQYVRGVVVSEQYPIDCCNSFTSTISVNIDCVTPTTTLEWKDLSALPPDMIIENGTCLNPYLFPSTSAFGEDADFIFPLNDGIEFESDCTGVARFSSTHTPQSGFDEGVTTVSYTVTDDCGNRLTHSFSITIECTVVPPPPPPPSGDDEIFDDYPWLGNLVDRQDCDGTVITLYELGIFNFLHIESTEAGTLYFQDGTQYCTDSPNFSCVAAYGLGQAIDSWECRGGVPPGPAPDLTLFDDYLFLSSVVDVTDCEGTIVNVYELGSFDFIHVQTVDSGVLYIQDGTRYCTDSASLSCIEAYKLSNPIRTWNCDDVGGGGNPADVPMIFEDYPWLDGVVDRDDCGDIEVLAYNLGSSVFLFVEEGDALMTMYSSTGQFYCSDSPGFSCFDAYGFDVSDEVDSWSCVSLQDESIDHRSIAEESIEYNIYPNPTTGKVTIDGLREGSQVMVYDLNGQLVIEQNEGETDVDLSSELNGVYLLMIDVKGKTSFHRLVKL